MLELIRTWLGRHWQRQEEYAVGFLDRLRSFGRANILTAAGILLALFAYYCVLPPEQTRDAAGQFGYNEHADQGRTLTSPDGRYAVSIGPAFVPQAKGSSEVRRLTVRATGSGSNDSNVLVSVQLPGFVAAHWSASSRFIAIVTAPGGMTGTMTRVIDVQAEATTDLSLPSSVDPAALLAGKDPAAELQSGSVRFGEWRGDTLRLVSVGHGWVGPPAAPDSRQVGVQCLFNLAVSGQHIRELSREC